MKMPILMQYKDDTCARAFGAHLSLVAGCIFQSLGQGDGGTHTDEDEESGKRGRKKAR